MCSSDLAVIGALLVVCALHPNEAGALFSSGQQWVVARFDWFYVLAVTTFLVFLVLIAASDFGNIRLGPDDAEPGPQARRLKSAPAIPSADEAGLPGYEFVTWYGYAAPRGTPAAIVNLLNRQMNAMLDDPAIQQFLTDGGMESLRHTPESFATLIRADYDKYGRIIRTAGIQPE